MIYSWYFSCNMHHSIVYRCLQFNHIDNYWNFSRCHTAVWFSVFACKNEWHHQAVVRIISINWGFQSSHLRHQVSWRDQSFQLNCRFTSNFLLLCTFLTCGNNPYTIRVSCIAISMLYSCIGAQLRVLGHNNQLAAKECYGVASMM